MDGALAQLAARGHRVHVAANLTDGDGGPAAVERLAAATPGITFGWAPSRPDNAWSQLTMSVRQGLDYLRYLKPEYDATPALRRRVLDRTPRLFLAIGEHWLGRNRLSRWALGRALTAVEREMPRCPEVNAYIREHDPDVVMITPLIGLGTSEYDYLISARALGYPTAFPVFSWDNLSSKSLVRHVPDSVIVWNDTQRQEAIALHHIPRSRVAVTGAHCFDRWFEARPSRSRAAFCERAGLPADRPILLWVCSGMFAVFKDSPKEADLVRRWVTQVRGSADPRLREAAILVRPHPRRFDEWQGIDLKEFPHVALWGANPIDQETRADYFDALYHSNAVVGLNTSAFLEAAIAGRPVFTILRPEFYEKQEGTIHFAYLLEAGGGLLHTSRDFDEHLVQLSSALADPERASAKSRAFVSEFIRPFGLDQPGTPKFVEAVERTAALGRRPERRPAWWWPIASRLLARLVSGLEEPKWQRLLLSPKQLEEVEHQRAKRDEWAARRAATLEQRTREREAAVARREAEREARRLERDEQIRAKRREKDEARRRAAASRSEEPPPPGGGTP